MKRINPAEELAFKMCARTAFFSFMRTVVLLMVAWAIPAGAADRTSTTPGAIHFPAQPRSGEPVVVTANLPYVSAILEVQVVSPGAYIRRTDRAFESSWQTIPMEQHGASFIARVAGKFQKHRTLIRYRFKGTNDDESEEFFPSKTNAVPNLSWFVYDGLPEWRGASQPGRPPEWAFSPDFLSTLPTYHLIANGDDVKNSQWNPKANRKPFRGTLVYEGRVYDHITFHNRGRASTYVAGKNKWGMKFNPGDSFAARNNLGKPYRYEWAGLNLNPCASAWAPINRGMSGMDEAISYRAYQLAGVPSPDTFWIHFRVIDSAEETPSNQYNGDLWGLYLVVQEKNGTWLSENHFPDGDIYSIDSGPKHLATSGRRGQTMFRQFRSATNERQTEKWWRANLDLPAYYSFHALNRLVANIDLRPDGNHYLYFRPDGRTVILPHDLDMMLIPKKHQPGYVSASSNLELPALKLEYQARAREILDLFASDSSPSGGQVGQLVAELAAYLRPPGHKRTWAELDEAMWNWHPRSHHKGQFNITPYEDHRMGGHWTRTLSTPDFSGFCKYIVDFCTDSRLRKNYRPNDGNHLGYGYGYLAHEAHDEKIPTTPQIRYAGPENFPPNKLSFAASKFTSPVSAKAGSVQWRIAEISAPGLKGFKRGKPYCYELETIWSSEESLPGGESIQIPAQICAPGRTYRARVRYKDDAGRWSHWSAPMQFVTGAE